MNKHAAQSLPLSDSRGAADVPGYLDLVVPAETEDRAPLVANFVNVHGEGDVFALDFFYVHPAKVGRIFEGGALPSGARREGDTVHHQAEPVARIVVPLTTATELVTELVERIGAGVPNLQGVLAEFGAKLHALAHPDGSDDGEDDDHDHDHEHTGDDGEH